MQHFLSFFSLPSTRTCWRADYIRRHQWPPEEPGDHGGQDSPVQEEADGPLSPGAAGSCLRSVVSRCRLKWPLMNAISTLLGVWINPLALSVFPCFIVPTPVFLTFISSYGSIFLAGANQTRDTAEKWICYPSGRGAPQGAAGQHPLWTEFPHTVQGKCLQFLNLASLLLWLGNYYCKEI